jgi:beta-lactamase class A
MAPQFQPLQKDLEKMVAELTKSGALEKASIYFKDLKSGQWIDIGPQEKFYTASLGKIPIMIAYFRLAESDPAILQKKIYYPGGNDLNQQQEIQPTAPVVAGTSYTTQELIEKMIWYSDNNAANLLTSNIDQGLLRSVYNDLEIPILDNVTTDNLDYMTTKNFSLFFRVLYNATYLSREYSEKALEVLTGTDFNKGILAGIPAGTTVSHKFGLTSVARNGLINERELHECGIVYHSRHPYFVCVMTRSSSSLPVIEQSLKNISEEIFRTVDSDYKS